MGKEGKCRVGRGKTIAAPDSEIEREREEGRERERDS